MSSHGGTLRQAFWRYGLFHGMRIALAALVLVAVPAIAHADDLALDGSPISDEALARACADGSDACKKAIVGCEATRSRLGGYLAFSNLAHQCTVLGVPAPHRDLSTDELAQAEASCALEPRGVACRSLDSACALRGDDTSFVNLTAACALVTAAAVRKPPPDPGVNEMWAGIGAGDVADPEQLGDTRTTIFAEMMMHGLIGLHRVAPAVALDLQLGSTSDGGFLYRLDVGWGVGLRFKHDGILALTVGGGFSGITGGRLGFAWEVPVEMSASVPIGQKVRGLFTARGAFVFREDNRQDGFPGIPLYDEVDAKAGLAYEQSDDLFWGLYGFVSHARETAVVGIALALGYAQVQPGPKR